MQHWFFGLIPKYTNCSNGDNNRSCQGWPNSFRLNLSCLPTFLSCPWLLIQMCEIPFGSQSEPSQLFSTHRGPLASMTNACSPYGKLHVCLVLNQTHKKRTLALKEPQDHLEHLVLPPLLFFSCEKKWVLAAQSSHFDNIYWYLFFNLHVCGSIIWHTWRFATLSTCHMSHHTRGMAFPPVQPFVVSKKWRSGTFNYWPITISSGSCIGHDQWRWISLEERIM